MAGLALLAAVMAAGLTACNYTKYFHNLSGYSYGSRERDDPIARQIRSYGGLTGDARLHDNPYFEYSSALSRQVASLPGINTAIVFLADRNAYVGLVTDWSATGTQGKGGPDNRDQDNTGTMSGVYNPDTGSPKWDNRHVATPYNSYFTHRDVSDLSSKLRQTVGHTIQTAHPRVRQVYISANREFVNQLAEFAKEAWAGRPLRPLTPEFNRLVQYVFGLGKEIPLPLYERNPDADSPGGVGPEPKDGNR
jgi:hypothetical protein